MSLRLAAACAALPALLACATAPQGPTVQMDKIRVVAARQGDGSYASTATDAASVFETSVAAHQSDRLEMAAGGYRELLREFPESEYTRPALYNLGMALEGLGKTAEAVEAYEALIAVAPDTDDARDASFRLAAVLSAEGRPGAAHLVLRRLLDEWELSPIDTYIARIRLGGVLLTMGRLDEAEYELRVLLAKARPRPGREGPLLAGGLLAEAQYTLARVHRARFDSLPIRLPLEQMGKDVAAKIEVFKHAQSAYLRTVRIGEVSMTTAAGLELGQMYEDFCRAFVEAPIPDTLSGEEVGVYYELLQREVRPLLEEALHVYEKNLDVARRLGASNGWVDSTRRRLEALREVLREARGIEDLKRFLGVPPEEDEPEPGPSGPGAAAEGPGAG